MRTLRICYVGGLDSIHLRRHADWMIARGHEVHVITWSFPDLNRLSMPGAHVWKTRFVAPGLSRLISANSVLGLRVDILSKPLLFNGFREILEKIRPDVTHGHFLTNTASLVAHAGSGAKVLTAWGSDVLRDGARSALCRGSFARAARRSGALISVASHLLQRMHTMRIESKFEVVVPMGVDLEQFRLASRPTTAQPRLVSLRSLAPVYDVKTLIDAVPYVIHAFPDCRIIIVGDGPLRKTLEERARHLGVAEHVDFLGNVPHEQVPEILGASDLYISTARSDGASVSLLEAMACGVPPIATDIPANREWIANAENGFLFPVGDSVDLAQKVVTLLQEPALQAKFATKGRRIVELRADWKKCMEKLEAVYEILV